MGISTPLQVSADHASCELLRAIARLPAGGAADRIDWLAERVRDWDGLFRMAEEHRMLPMLASQLGEMGPAVPPVMQERLRAAYDRNAFHSLANAAELISLLRAFDQAKIAAMPFKGVVLGASVYHDLTTRPAGDLDVLIRYTDVLPAAAILLKRGYELKTPVRANGMPVPSYCYEYHFERQTDGMVMELRWRLELSSRHFKRDLGMDWVWPRRRTAMLAGAEVPVMSPEITLLVLCMHGSKHVWSRLIWIRDVAQLLDSVPGLDWQEVLHEGKRLGLRRTLTLGVLLAHRVAGAAVPPAVLRRYESDTTARKLAQYIEESLFNAPGNRPAARLPYGIQLLGFRDRINFLLSLDFVRPNERDQAALALPKLLYPLYYLIRLFRILWDHSPR
ncbi:nucleotidyltransferase domain-containing protein [Tunturiibacter gelidiferens]|uniref:nucleotidyltransferase domain-containing protein n=1 Tax=Tunturiibacter gelidiferens TaxID=3069689 RepID=UPI003D9B2E43